jgi:hypothetical protein
MRHGIVEKAMAIDYGGRKPKDEPADLEELIESLEHKVERLKVLYEQYFMGIEKVEPQTARKEVERKIIEFTQMQIRNTALRYRFNALNQKWGVYRTYWSRTLREIEKGTYVRNLSKVSREAIRKGEDIPEEVLRSMPDRMRERVLRERALVAERAAKGALRRRTSAPGAVVEPMGEDEATQPVVSRAQPLLSDDDEIDSLFDKITTPAPTAISSMHPRQTQPSQPPPPPPTPRATLPGPAPVKRPTLPPGMDEAKLHDLYKRYIQAKRVVGEDASRIKVENLIATINAQAPKIMSQYNAKTVEFSVVVKDNRVILKATPKK